MDLENNFFSKKHTYNSFLVAPIIFIILFLGPYWQERNNDDGLFLYDDTCLYCLCIHTHPSIGRNSMARNYIFYS